MARKEITKQQAIENAQVAVIEATESYRKWARAVAYKANCPDLVQVLLDMPVSGRIHEDYVQSRRTLNIAKQSLLLDQMSAAVDANDRSKVMEIKSAIEALDAPITWHSTTQCDNADESEVGA